MIAALYERIRFECLSFAASLSFYTRLPLPAHWQLKAEHLAASAKYAPLAGIILALLAALVGQTAAKVWTVEIAAALSLLTTIFLSGALHEDGLADTMDGFGGGHTAADILRIMKDSRIGTYGALALGLSLLLRFSALCALPTAHWWQALALAHGLSRSVAVACMSRLDYARPGGKAQGATSRLHGIGLGLCLLFGLLPILVLPSTQARDFVFYGLPALIVFYFWVLSVLAGRLGGYTGDTLGAVQQGAEVACLLVLSASVWNPG